MKKGLFKNILLFIFAIFLCFLLLELGIRFFYPVINVSVLDKEIFRRDDVLGYVLKPNIDITKENVGKIFTTRSNSNGLRNDQDYNKGGHPNSFRILGLGDSVTYGFGVNIEDTYLKILESKLNKVPEKSRRKYEVINAAFPGWSIAQELLFLVTEGMEYKPDLVTVGFVDDDIFRNDKYYDSTMSLALSSGEMPRENIGRLAKAESDCASLVQGLLFTRTKLFPFIFSKTQSLRSEYFMDYSINQTQSIFLALNEFCNNNDIPLLVVVIPLRKEETTVNNIMISFFKENNIKSLDLRDSFLRSKQELFLAKDNHPNPEGHKLIAGEIFKYLRGQKNIK